MCGAVLAVALTGCTREIIDDGGEGSKGGNKSEGVSTYATFNFRMSGVDTRAADMIDDSGEIDDVKDIRLIIFKTGASTSCEVNEVYTSSDTDWVNNKSKTVQLTSGSKRIFVITNAEKQSALSKFLDGTSIVVGSTTLSQFYNMVYDLGAPKLANIDKLKELVDKSNGYVMSNTMSAKSAFVLVGGIGLDESRKGGATENNFTIEIQRTVAKTFVYYENASVLETKDKTGAVSDLKYMLQNVNRSLYMFQKFATDMVDPSVSIPRSPYYLLPTGTPVATYDTTYYRDYKFIPVGTSKTGKYVYATENTSETPRNATTTYAAIQSVFLPKKGMIVEQVKYNPLINAFHSITTNTADAKSAATLYRLVNIGSSTGITANVFFTDKTLAYKTAYCIKNNSETGFDVNKTDELKWDGAKGTGYITEYTGGMSYHRLNLGEGSGTSFDPGLRRNNLYNARITSFSGIGAPNLDDLNNDPDKPIGQKTHVTATITIAPWTVVASDTEF
jgi:hypothetical protein